MIVIGSVAVDRDGRRIGKGNGYVDLDFALLVHCGVITNDTLIVTTVHDAQVLYLSVQNLCFRCFFFVLPRAVSLAIRRRNMQRYAFFLGLGQLTR